MPYQLPEAKSKVTDYATSRYGRGPANDEEWGAIAKGINYDDGVSDDELNTAYGNVDSYAASLGAKPITSAATPSAPAPDPVQDVYSGTTVVPPNLTSLAPGLFNPTTPSPVDTAGRDALLKLLETSQQTPSLDDPTLKPQMDAFRVAQQRSAERARGSAAERLAQEGMASGGTGGPLETAIGKIESGRGFNEGQFGASLIGGEMNARRQQLMQGIELATSLGDREATRQLQTQLSLLDAALSRETSQGSLALQKELGTGDLGLRKYGIDQNSAMGRLNALLSLYGMNLQNDQFNTQQGFNWTQLQTLLNQRNLETLLGGGL